MSVFSRRWSVATTVAVVAIAVMILTWVGSTWFQAGWAGSRGSMVWLEGGRIYIIRQNVTNYPAEHVGWAYGSHDTPFRWWYEDRLAWPFGIAMPIWPLTIVLGVGTWVGRWVRHRARVRTALIACVHCGYERKGLLPDSVCPECGHPPGR